MGGYSIMRLEWTNEILADEQLKKSKASSHESCSQHTKYWKWQVTKMSLGAKGNCKRVTLENKHEKSEANCTSKIPPWVKL